MSRPERRKILGAVREQEMQKLGFGQFSLDQIRENPEAKQMLYDAVKQRLNEMGRVSSEKFFKKDFKDLTISGLSTATGMAVNIPALKKF